MLPELELLLCCTRTKLTPPRAARIHQLVREPLDWQYIIDSARWHSITPLLYWQLKSTCPQTVPPDILQGLAAEFASSLQQNLFLTAQLLKILKKFREQKIPVIPFKGSVLAATLYNNLALRRFRDIDLLLDREHFFAAQQILETSGYQTKPPLNRRQQQVRLNANYEQDFFNEELQINIDLHWGIAPPFFSIDLPTAELLQTNSFLDLGGHRVPTLSPENTLTVLCINGTKEGWSYLQRLCDIAETIAVFPHLNWSKLFAKSRQANCLESVLLGIYLVGELLQNRLPEAALLELERHPHIASYYPQILQRISETRVAQLKPTNLAYFAWKLQSGLSNKCNYLLKIALPLNERDLDWIALPKILFPLYYPLRLLRLISKYGFSGQKKESIERR